MGRSAESCGCGRLKNGPQDTTSYPGTCQRALTRETDLCTREHGCWEMTLGFPGRPCQRHKHPPQGGCAGHGAGLGAARAAGSWGGCAQKGPRRRAGARIGAATCHACSASPGVTHSRDGPHSHDECLPGRCLSEALSPPPPPALPRPRRALAKPVLPGTPALKRARRCAREDWQLAHSRDAPPRPRD